MVVAHVVRPGAGMNIDPASLDASKVANFAAKAHDTTVIGFLDAMVPETFLASLTGGNILQVLVVAVLFGVSLASVGERGARVAALLEDCLLYTSRCV